MASDNIPVKKQEYDFIVIGGGPAGSSAAAFLAESGKRVCVVERKSFPREVLCGEFLSAEVIRFLRRQGLFEKFLKLGPQKITSFRLINTNGKELRSGFIFEAYALKRSLFDELLLENCSDKGADIIIPAEVNSVKKVKDKYEVVIKSSNEEFCLTTAVIIGAYGKQNPFDKHFNRSFIKNKSVYTGVKYHISKRFFVHPPGNEIQMYLGNKIYCGINPVSDDEYAICYLSKGNKQQINPKENLKFLLQENKKFRDLFVDSGREVFSEQKVYGTGNIYFGRKEQFKDGIYFTGDAAGVIAPLAGDGIGMALQSAELLARHLRQNTKGSAYQREWNKLFSGRLKTAYIIQSILLGGSVRHPAVKLAAMFPGVLVSIINSTRSIK